VNHNVTEYEIDAVRQSGLFDAEWYQNEYPDVKALGIDPLVHYLTLGAKLKRNPSPAFDSSAYLYLNSDVEQSDMNPLLHYVLRGINESRPTQKTIDELIHTYNHTRDVHNKPIVIYDSHNLKQQGAPNSLFEIASGIMKRQSFSAFLLSSSKGPLLNLYHQNDINFFLHGFSHNRIYYKWDGSIKYLSMRLKELNPAIIHVNTLQNFHSIFAAHHAGIPVVWNIRESEHPESYFEGLPDQVRDIAKTCYGLVDCVVFVAEATRKLWGNTIDKLSDHTVIGNGVDTDRLMSMVYGVQRPVLRKSMGIEDDDILVLTVGTVCERKGQEDLISAIKMIEGPAKRNIVFAFAGFNDCDYSRKISDDIDTLVRMGYRINKVPESRDETSRRIIAELYLAADVFVLNSRNESYPRVTLEAMSFGLAVISTPCFGVLEQLESGENALIYDIGDIQTLYMHLMTLYNESDRRIQLARAATARLSTLNSYTKMLESYEDIYKRILHKRNSGRLQHS